LLKVGLALAILVGFTLVLLPRIAGWFFAGPGQSSLGRFVFVFGAMSLSGLVAGIMGIEGLVGAFFAGIGLNRYVPNGGRLMDRVEFFGNALFVPAFLISVGMLINPAVIFNKQTLFLALMLGGGLLLGKLSAAFITGKIYKFSYAEIGTMFSLTFAQAAATLASALVGLKIGLFTNDIVNAVLLVVLISLIVSSIGTSFFSGRVKPERVSINPVGRAVMVLIQPGLSLKKLMKIAAAIAHNDAGVVSPISIALEYQGEEAQQKALAILEKAEKYGVSETADTNPTMRIDSSVHYGFIRELTENKGTLALVEWKTGTGPMSFLFGNIIDRIGTHSPVPVAAVHFDSEELNRVVLVTGSNKPTAGYYLDLKIGFEIAERLTRKLHIPYIIIAQQKKLPDDVTIPKSAKIIESEAGIDSVLPHLEAGDLVLVNWATIHRLIGSKAEDLRKATNDISIMITAGPHRLSLSSSETPYNPDSVISFGTASAD
jgi:nucleotide-binding universal stress UspA family protein